VSDGTADAVEEGDVLAIGLGLPLAVAVIVVKWDSVATAVKDSLDETDAAAESVGASEREVEAVMVTIADDVGETDADP
jgi:hypothetical protein